MNREIKNLENTWRPVKKRGRPKLIKKRAYEKKIKQVNGVEENVRLLGINKKKNSTIKLIKLKGKRNMDSSNKTNSINSSTSSSNYANNINNVNNIPPLPKLKNMSLLLQGK
jgi:hypothetical protein